MDTSKTIKVQILNAFVENDKGGNPAGVVLNADNLSNNDKLKIAKQVGLSETAFISKSKIADFKLDFFTPNKQIAHCGHATIATFSFLQQLELVNNSKSSKETIDGIRKIELSNDIAYMEQLAPKYRDITEKENIILDSLGIKKVDLIPNATIKLVNTGNSFIIIPVKNSKILQDLTPNFNLISEISETFDLIGYYVFSTETKDSEIDATSRMFAPRYGILEESATGMAAGPLACYLYDILKIKKERFYLQQGKYMKEPSSSSIVVDLKVKNGNIINLMAGGKGLLKEELQIKL